MDFRAFEPRMRFIHAAETSKNAASNVLPAHKKTVLRRYFPNWRLVTRLLGLVLGLGPNGALFLGAGLIFAREAFKPHGAG